MNGIKSIYIYGLARVRVKGYESEWFRIDGEVKQWCIMSPCLFNVFMGAVMKGVDEGIDGGILWCFGHI